MEPNGFDALLPNPSVLARDSDAIGRLVKESCFVESRRNCNSHASLALDKNKETFFNVRPQAPSTCVVLFFHVLLLPPPLLHLCIVLHFSFLFALQVFALCIQVALAEQISAVF